MRTIRCAFSCLTILSAITLTLPALADSAVSSATAKVVRIEKNARVSFDGRTWQPLKKGMSISENSTIQTGEDASVEIALGGVERVPSKLDDTVRLGNGSVLRIDRLGMQDGANTIELDLLNGEMTVHSGVVGNGSHFEIKFADGIVGVRSGVFTMNTLGLLDVTEGKIVAAMYRDAKPQVVTAGHHFDATTGQVSDLVIKSVTETSAMKPVTPATRARKF